MKKPNKKNMVKVLFSTIALLIGVYILTYLLYLDHNDFIDEVIQDFLFVISLLIFFAIVIRSYSLFTGYMKIRNVFGSQVADKTTRIINNCQPLHKTFAEKKDHVVILLHGFISSPVIFDELVKELEENEIDYHAPLINGFGIKRVQLLFSLNEKDWIRQVTDVYDILASQYKHISVIGHSLGGALALYLSQIRPVNHLVLFAPALFPCKSQKIHNFLASNDLLYKVVPWIIPLLPVLDQLRDEFDDNADQKYTLYPVAPTRGALNILRLQAQIDIKKSNYQTLDLLYGEKDMAVDGKKIWDYLKDNNMLHRVHRFDHTGHNPLIDRENDLARWIVGYILRDELSWPPEGVQTDNEPR